MSEKEFVKVEDPIARATQIEEQPRWLNEEEEVEVIYGEFHETETSREDEETGNKYVTRDFRIGCNQDGKHVYKLVNKYVYVDIVRKFQEAKKAKNGETMPYVRPPSPNGSRRRRRR